MNNLLTGKNTMDMAEYQEILTGLEWNESFVIGLDRFLKSHNIRSILDCCGGTGFPALQLKGLGWDVTYADGSELMLKEFTRKLHDAGLEMQCILSDWLDLSQRAGKTFDCVLCRGNSLIYIDSWETNRMTSATRTRIEGALKEFFKLLNKGGLLYVDIYAKRFDMQPGPFFQDFATLGVKDDQGKISWSIEHDYSHKIRIWKSTLWYGGEKYEFCHRSYLLTHAELVEILYGIGFTNVEETHIEGESTFTVYVAHK